MQKITRFFSTSSTTAKYFLDNKLQNATLSVPKDQVGTLAKISNIFYEEGINMTYIKSTMETSLSEKNKSHLSISFEKKNNSKMNSLKQKLSKMNMNLKEKDPIRVPWFPRVRSDINKMGTQLYVSSQKPDLDHPNYTDKEYLKRRQAIIKNCLNHKLGDPIPTVDYLPQEHELWRNIFKKLSTLHKKVMNDRYLFELDKLEKQFNISKRVPQLAELDAHIKSETGFTLKPSIGTISQRQFLNTLAFKVFTCTQFLRHHTALQYTPEPDLVHEIIGHVVMLSDPSYAQIHQVMGLQSLGATDQQISQIGALYMYTIQFGAIEKDGERRTFGAGVGGSAGEMQHFISGKPKFRPFKPAYDAKQELVFHDVQPVYKTSSSFEQAVEKTKQFGRSLEKPFTSAYNAETDTIQYDRCIQAIEAQEKPVELH